MTDDMLGPSPMHIKYESYVYDGPIFLVPLSLSYPSSPVLNINLFSKVAKNQTTILSHRHE